LRITFRSTIKLMIFISVWQWGQIRGSISHTFFICPRSQCPWGTFPAERRRDSPWPVVFHVNHCQLADVYRFLHLLTCTAPLLQLTPLAPHAVRVPAVLANKLEALFRDMLGDIRDKLICCADGEVLFGDKGLVYHSFLYQQLQKSGSKQFSQGRK
jgi:hypothetical protein